MRLVKTNTDKKGLLLLGRQLQMCQAILDGPSVVGGCALAPRRRGVRLLRARSALQPPKVTGVIVGKRLMAPGVETIIIRWAAAIEQVGLVPELSFERTGMVNLATSKSKVTAGLKHAG